MSLGPCRTGLFDLAAPARQCPRQVRERLLVALVADFAEVARELQHHPLARIGGRRCRLSVQPFVEIADRDAEHAGDLEETAGGYAIDATLVFMRLLIGDADEIGYLLLRQPHHDASPPDPAPSLLIHSF